MLENRVGVRLRCSKWQQLPTSYTDKILVSDEVAEFSPEIIDEMKAHVAKYPAERSRSALIPLSDARPA